MSTGVGAQAGKRIVVHVPKGSSRLVSRDTLQRVLEGCFRQIGFELIIDGAENVKADAQGSISAKISAGAGTQPPFTILGSGKILPGLVAGLMPTLGGEGLDTTSNKIDLTSYSGSFLVWFHITYDVTYDANGFMTAWTPTTVVVETGTTLPTDTDEEKYLHFNTVDGGVPVGSFFSSSVAAVLYDNGAHSTIMATSDV